MAMLTKVACVVVVVCMVVVATHVEAVILCGQVSRSLAPCITYLKSGGPVPTACCDGVKAVKSGAKTKSDRQDTCKCLKHTASGIKGINTGYASSLPGKCGVSVPYPISPSIDCSKVQ